MAMSVATRVLLRSFRRPLSSPPIRPPTTPAGLLHGSPLQPPPRIPHTQVRQRLHTLPRALLPNIRLFGGRPQYPSSSKAASPRRMRSIPWSMLSAFFFSWSDAALQDLDDEPHSVSDSDAATLLYWDDGNENNPPTRPRVEREKRRVTDALIALHLLVHGADVLTKRKLYMWGTKNNELIRTGQIWRLATSPVLHGGFLHIMLNMLFLDDIGPTMEEINGHGRFLAIYCASALAGSLMSYRFTPEESIGASDALYGLVGAQAVHTWRRRESLTSSTDTFKEIAEMIVLNLAFGLTLRLIKIRVDDWAHLGGLVGGAAAHWFLGPHEKQHVARVGTMVFEDRTPVLSD